ncbi:hypothetical protein BDW75DRAFT_196272 [Aspergillus navahoensis]
MPLVYKKSSPSSAGSAPEQGPAPTTGSKLSLRSLFNRKARVPAATGPQSAVRTHSHQAPTPAPKSDQNQQLQEPNSCSSAHHASSGSSPMPTSPSTPEPKPQSQSRTQTQTTWEDIDPPTSLLSLTADLSISSASIASRYHDPTHDQLAIPSTPTATTMLTSSTPAASTRFLLPSYSDVSGAVVVDAHGSPRFLTPQEEQERKDALAQAVRERMMGLPRRTDFSWEASAAPVLPRYEDAAVAGKLQGG